MVMQIKLIVVVVVDRRFHGNGAPGASRHDNRMDSCGSDYNSPWVGWTGPAAAATTATGND